VRRTEVGPCREILSGQAKLPVPHIRLTDSGDRRRPRARRGKVETISRDDDPGEDDDEIERTRRPK
jgi:hypothetical protein